MIDSIPLKRCTKCQQEFPATTEYFHRDKRLQSGIRSCCRVCSCKIAFAYAETNREAQRERARQYYDANREILREKAIQRYYANHETLRERQRMGNRINPEEWREQRRKYRAVHCDRYREYRRLYRKANRQKKCEQEHRRRARKYGRNGSYTIDDVRLQLKMQTDRKGIARCWWCSEPLGNNQSIDHRIPLSRGGSNDARNICITHLKCNMIKNDKLPHEYNGRLL